ncbi:hypothetical protein [Candidatus Villigracilis saccharophilus]|uniref:hypothetical protein n=1 Tax=Candidatus Villigracilis saccharophilus TaxID=3140684 RepID=UPI003136C8EE|nr:hypothetical protein [Anaerolineales bacterium]
MTLPLMIVVNFDRRRAWMLARWVAAETTRADFTPDLGARIVWNAANARGPQAHLRVCHGHTYWHFSLSASPAAC